jgi:hypothetical protein
MRSTIACHISGRIPRNTCQSCRGAYFQAGAARLPGQKTREMASARPCPTRARDRR